MHGSIRHLQRTRPARNNCTQLHNWQETECQECGGPLRPNIMMFNDADYVDDHQEALKEQYGEFIHAQEGKRLVILVLGVGTAVPTIQGEINYVLRYVPSAREIHINPDQCSLSDPLRIASGALAGVRQLRTEIRMQNSSNGVVQKQLNCA
jgi:NAD-dependent SIR2 family protein deacetylase